MLQLHIVPTEPFRTEPMVAMSGDDAGSAWRNWLVRQALPAWARIGVDRDAGGFFEQIDLQGRACEAPRRARVVARQIYVFAVAARRGWLQGADALVDHGLHFLLGKMRRADGSFASSVHPDGVLVDPAFDLYEQAFVLFALAAAREGRPDREPLRAEAEGLLDALRGGWAHPCGGFEENRPRSVALRSNPHMHLLEAALAWHQQSEGGAQRIWGALADELVALCLAHFIDPASGALLEHFDADWQALPGAAGARVEPGHQFEWAWLLMRWARHGGRPQAMTAARRLLEIGEVHGVDRARGVAVDALGAGLHVTEGAAKVWPQTERIKAWHAAQTDGTAAQAAAAHAKVGEALQSLGRYVLASPAGLWHEQMRADGSFALQPCRASSLYHIVCAIDTLQDAPATFPLRPAPPAA